MPVMSCQINGQSGYKYGSSGKCYIGKNAKQMAVKQAIAIGGGSMPKDTDIEFYEDDLIFEDVEDGTIVLDFIPPPYPKNMPAKYVKILKATYSNIRGQWVKENPKDPENKTNKEKAAKIAWNAVKEAGYEIPKDEDDIKDKKPKKEDSDWEHIAIIRNIEDFQGGTFESEWYEDLKGVYIQKGALKDDMFGIKEPYKYSFSINQWTEQQAKDYLEKEGIKFIKFIPATKKRTDSKINLHLDTFDETKALLTTNITRTNEGYLKGRAIVTNTGIFNYLVDGKVVKELRENDEVFKSESLESLKNIPITDGHPPEMINSENIKKYQVGFTGSDVQKDGHAVSIDYTITDREMIKKIESGEKRSLSCGYKADLDYSVAGSHYFGNNPVDAKQKNILYNHLAVVKNGRAGDLAKLPLRMDNVDLIHKQIFPENNDKEDRMEKTTIKIDGVDYQVDNDIAKHIHSLNTAIDQKDNELKETKTKLTDAEAKRDANEAEIKKIKDENEKNKLTDEQIQNKVNERIDLLKIADFCKVQYDSKTSNKDIILNIIKTKNNVDMIDKTEDYINAYFDSVKNFILKDMETQNGNKNKEKVFGDHVNQIQNPLGTKTKQQLHDEMVEKTIKQSQEYRGAVSV